MNKAFIREPDDVASRCPDCQTMGQSVGPETLNAQLSSEVRKRLAESAYFCPDEHCKIVYFDDYSAIVTRSQFSQPIPLKDLDAPICSCFGTSREDIDRDIAEGSVVRTKAAILKAQSSEARCTSKSPNGRLCIQNLQGYYFKQKQRRESF